MTYQEIKNFINTYIVQNGVNAITGAQLNTILNELADYKGFDSVFVTTLPAGSDATVTVQGMTLVLGIPKGADGRDGRDGQNAVNPFKGWYTTDNIPTEGQAGDYCNVMNTQTQTVTIYRWDATQNAFVDTGEVPDTATGETFASSETLQQVAIDNSHLVNPTNSFDQTKPVLAQAEDVMQLKTKLEGVDAVETKVVLTENTNYYSGKYVTTNGKIANGSTPTNGTPNCILIVPCHNYKEVRWLGFRKNGNNSAGVAYGFSKNAIDVTNTTNVQLTDVYEYPNGAVSDTAEEMTIKVPSDANYFICTIRTYGDSSTRVMTIADFYCYLQSGDAVGDLYSSLRLELDNPTNVSMYNAFRLERIILSSTLKWDYSTTNLSALIPVTDIVGKKLHIVKADNMNTHYAFLTDYPVSEETDPQFVAGTSLYYLINENDAIVEVPKTSKYLYIKLRQNDAFYGPKSIKTIPNEVVVDSWDAGVKYDTFIEENIYRYESGITNAQVRVKIYKIEKGVEYALILKVFSEDSNQIGVKYLDSNMNLISSDYTADGQSQFYEMIPLSIPQNCEYIKLSYHIKNGNPTNTGCGAIMKPLKNDCTLPTNLICYCVSKVNVPVIPNNYNDDDSFTRASVWSAWCFRLPFKGASTTLLGKKNPICSFFHGSSGFVSSDYMGYTSSTGNNGIVGELCKAGCIVFDINGYGISYNSDEKSHHWGNPIAVATAKKAYEVLVNRFNGRRGMVLGGISMGGAIAKSYAMIYPEDVVACAIEASSEIGCTCRFRGPYGSALSASTAAKAWGYSSEQDMYDDKAHENLLGYSPCVMPLVIDENGSLKKIDTTQLDFDYATMCGTMIGKFLCGFPVEIKIWHGDADVNVPLQYSQLFVNTVRNANNNATLRICPGCTHDLNTYSFVKAEVVDYIVDKLII